MPTLSVTFRDRTRAVFEGSEDRIAYLESRIRAAMASRTDTVISHDLDQEPKHFLCSDVQFLHRED